MNDKTIIRDLAIRVRDLASDDINRHRIKRSRDIHNLKPVRPLVWIDEIPWHEMDIDGELKLHCESDQAKQIEQHFRRILYRWKYIQADMVVEDTFYVEKSYNDSGIGISVREQTIATDTANYIVSHKYEDQLDSEDKIDKIKMPVIQANPDLDKKILENANEIIDGILLVRLRGHEVYFAPWDYIARFRGVENCLVDMIENPQLIHKTIAKFTEANLTRYTQMEEQGLLDYNQASLHCTPPYADGIPALDYDGGKVRFKDMWFRGMAQLFSCASPEMQDEFDLQYMRGIMEKFALSYYGCCEPLDKFIPYLKKIPNMRKIGISAWADVRSSAEQIGSDYVFAYKPNPAYVAGDFNKKNKKKEIMYVLEECIKNKCPLEFVLKDISTVNRNPYNLIYWTNTVMELLDHYYS